MMLSQRNYHDFCVIHEIFDHTNSELCMQKVGLVGIED